jgi:PhzF family phenazine biosynthesis protein
MNHPRETPVNRRFQIVDVFHDQPFTGNPLAVVLDSDGLTPEKMLQVTRWLNFSETTFLLPPTSDQADYRVRIFTPDRELPFAGHPTLGSCHTWLTGGGKPRRGNEIVQECGAGLIPLRRVENKLAFAAPPLIRSGPVEEDKLEETARVLGIPRSAIVDAQWADNGPGWVAVLLASAEAVLELNPALDQPRRVDIGVVGPYPAGGPITFELRAFFTDHNGSLREDPVTGSLNASVAQWLLGSGRARAPYTAAQGARIGCSGRIFISQDTNAVWVGGNTTTLFEGHGNF